MQTQKKTEKQKGMIVGILENKEIGNCSNNGISSKFKSVYLVGENVPEIFETDNDRPVVLVDVKLVGNNKYFYARPVDEPEGIGWMMGGCFIWSCDGRFPSRYPIPLHDRQESSELNEVLSK